MPTLERIFKKEFRDTTAKLYTNKSVYELPNPLEGALGVAQNRAYLVKGIADEGSDDSVINEFSVLNDKVVIDMGKVAPELTVRVHGQIQYDVNGEVEKQRPPTPTGSVWVRTKQPVKIPRRADLGKFGYANIWDQAPDAYKYVYCIPKEYLYLRNMCALVVSTRKLKAYKGYSFQTWSSGKITVAVIPYNPNQKYQNTVILGTKASDDFDKEMHFYVQKLIEAGIIPDPAHFQVDAGNQNLVTQEIEPAFEGYNGNSEISLAEEGALSYAKASQFSDDDPHIEWE